MNLPNPTQHASFKIGQRVNVHVKNGTEYYLNVSFGDTKIEADREDTWTLTTWDTAPSMEAVEKACNLSLRAMQVYHQNQQIPRFALVSSLEISEVL